MATTPTTARTYDLLRALSDSLYKELAEAQAQRDRRPDLIDGPHGPECAWVIHEREVMLGAVNRLRAGIDAGLPPVAMAEVERADQLACGHVDYSRKFAWRCAELVLEGGAQ
jgi:hypothetical protein